jgi:hypothetical protein
MSDRTFYERVEESRGFKFIRLKSGRLLSFWEAIRAAERANTSLARAVSRAFKLADDDYDLERLRWLIENLEAYVGAIRKELDKRQGVKSQKERIALLRNTAGRSPKEARAFNSKADELERRLEAGAE